MSDLVLYDSSHQQVPVCIKQIAQAVLIGRVKLDAVRSALQNAQKIGIDKAIYDAMKADGQEYGERILDAELILAEYLKSLPKASGGDRKSDKIKNHTDVIFDNLDQPTKKDTVEALGFTRMEAHRIQQLTPEAVEEAKSVARKNNDIPTRSLALEIVKQNQRQERIETITHTIQQSSAHHNTAGFVNIFNTSDKFRVIYADPPWDYDMRQEGASGTGAIDHYPTMPLPDICMLPVKALAMSNAVLFLWTTSPLLEKAFSVINAWNFAYKASFVWDKVSHNLGHYNSVRHEFLLIATRGSCTPDIPKLYDSVVSIERTEHSKKPEEFRQIIDTLYPSGERIELFARTAVSHWCRWGNEA
jgi:N6-adenosine-specific RNA methylase IME4